MSTTTEHPPVEPPKPDHHDEFTGAFGFFRKYQKLILYTAGIFALITFSITGAMTQWLRGITDGPTGPRPTIEMFGREIQLEVEDQTIGGLLARHMGALRTQPGQPGSSTILPEVALRGESTDLSTRLAILRRASIAAGLDVSMTEVDAAIDWMVRASNSQFKTNDTPTMAALQRGMNSLAEFRSLVKEALRIGNYVLLSSVGIDAADAAVMKKLVEGKDKGKLTVRVATFDMKALEQQLKQKGDITEANIREWMEKKTDDEKTRLEVFDTNKVSLVLGIARFKDFVADEWKDELSAFQFGDEQKQRLYKMEIDRFKNDKGKPKPIDDAEVAAELKKLAEVDEVLNKLLQKVREAQQAAIKPAAEKERQNAIEQAEAQQLYDAAQKLADATPGDAGLQQKAREAKEALEAKKNATTASAAELETVRSGFDFRGKWAELTKDKKGFELREIGTPRTPGPGDLKNAKALKDLATLELGEWKLPELATSLRGKGDLGGAPARAQHGAFLLQVTDVEIRPMRPWDDLKVSLEAKYFEEQAKKAGEEKKKLLEDELLRLAKEKIPERVAEIDAKRQPEVDRLFGEWTKKLEDQLAKATGKLAGLTAGTQAYAAWEAEKTTVEAQLKDRDAKRTAFEKEVKDKFDAEVATEAKKKYGEVLEAAAAAAGFTVTPVGPYRRDAGAQPLFDKRHDRTVAFLWSGIVDQLEVGECTAITEDTVERRWQIAVCDKVDPLTAADITRREFETNKQNFALGQMITAMGQSFTLEALKERYRYKDPEGHQEAR